MKPTDLVFELAVLVFERPGRYEFILDANSGFVGKSFDVIKVGATSWRGAMSTPVEIRRKSAGPEGATIAPGQPVPSRGFKMRLLPFMLEDHLDAIDARLALSDPENSERIRWQQLKEHLGL